MSIYTNANFGAPSRYLAWVQGRHIGNGPKFPWTPGFQGTGISPPARPVEPPQGGQAKPASWHEFRYQSAPTPFRGVTYKFEFPHETGFSPRPIHPASSANLVSFLLVKSDRSPGVRSRLTCASSTRYAAGQPSTGQASERDPHEHWTEKQGPRHW